MADSVGDPGRPFKCGSGLGPRSAPSFDTGKDEQAGGVLLQRSPAAGIRRTADLFIDSVLGGMKMGRRGLLSSPVAARLGGSGPRQQLYRRSTPAGLGGAAGHDEPARAIPERLPIV